MRGEARPRSDIDLLVDVVPGTSLFDVALMEDEQPKHFPGRSTW
jgi:predicted nucleotidyltransferase